MSNGPEVGRGPDDAETDLEAVGESRWPMAIAVFLLMALSLVPPAASRSALFLSTRS